MHGHILSRFYLDIGLKLRQVLIISVICRTQQEQRIVFQGLGHILYEMRHGVDVTVILGHHAERQVELLRF